MRWAWIDGTAWTTLRARLTLWNTAVVLLMTVTALVAVRFGAQAALYREVDAILLGSAREIALAIADLDTDNNGIVDELRSKTAGHGERGWFAQLLTIDGESLWKSHRCPAEVANHQPKATGRSEQMAQVGPYRYVGMAVTPRGQGPLFVRIGMSTELIDENIQTLMGLLIPVGVMLSLLTPLTGYWLAVRATRPVADILRTAERLRPTRLGDRLPVTGMQDELDQLSGTINRLLDQVADHVDRQEQFVADAAHELRGPLAAIQSSLEVAVSQDRSADEHRETLSDILDATRHLSKIANDLLILAETSDVGAPSPQEPVDLASVASQTVGMFAGVSEERGVDLRLVTRETPPVNSNPGHLRQVISNLLDNALRFTHRGGRIVVEVSAAAGSGLLTVTDTGTGIAAEHLSRIFDRFYKADPARSHGETRRSGGLGLAICKSLVESSGGSITVTSRPGEGTHVTIRLPAWHRLSEIPGPASVKGKADG